MLKKVGNAILDIVFFIVIVFAIVMIMLSINSDNNGVATLFGYIPFSIQTESMEPTIKVGDLIIVKDVDTATLKEGDVISFFALEEKTKIIKTHRIMEIKNDGTMISYVTQGDAAGTAIDEVEVAPGDIVGKWNGTRIAKLGSVYDFLNSKYGFLICIIVPLFIFFVYQIYKFVILIIDMKKGNKKQSAEE